MLLKSVMVGLIMLDTTPTLKTRLFLFLHLLFCFRLTKVLSPLSRTEYVQDYHGYYTLPNTPKKTGGLIYYFLGTQNNGNFPLQLTKIFSSFFSHSLLFPAGGGKLGLTILQPVLTYYYSWYMERFFLFIPLIHLKKKILFARKT